MSTPEQPPVAEETAPAPGYVAAYSVEDGTLLSVGSVAPDEVPEGVAFKQVSAPDGWGWSEQERDFVEPSAEVVAERQAVLDQQARVEAVKAKVLAGESLTQDERDLLLVLSLRG